MLNSIIRIPRLCDQFQKACKKKLTAEAIKRSQKEAHEHVSKEMEKDGQTEELFIESFMNHIDEKWIVKKPSPGADAQGPSSSLVAAPARKMIDRRVHSTPVDFGAAMS